MAEEFLLGALLEDGLLGGIVHRHVDLRLDAPIGGVLLAMHEAAAGQVVVGDGHLELAGAAFELDEFLNGTFAVRARADDQGALVVFQTAGDDLRGAGAVLVDQYDHREIGQRALGGGRLDVLGAAAALGADDHAFFQE